MLIKYVDRCQNCGEVKDLKRAGIGRERLGTGEERIFLTCHKCGVELDTEVVKEGE